MKNILRIAVISGVSLALATLDIQAGGKDWATAGKILTGVVAADILIDHLPAWQQPQLQCTMNTYRIVKDSPPPYVQYYQSDIYYSDVPIQVQPQPIVIQMAPPPVAISPSAPAQPAAASSTVALGNEEPSVIHLLSPTKRIYQPRIQGHKAYVQERVSPNHPWVTVEEYPSIW